MINNRFHISEKIGEGRTSVFLCADKNHPGKKFALKYLEKNSEEVDIVNFHNECDILSNLDYPSIVRFISKGDIYTISEELSKSFGLERGGYFCLLEFVEGQTLDKFLSDNKIDERFLYNFLTSFSGTLFYLHQANYIYFDLKPENIIVIEDSGNYRFKLIDFGLARFQEGIDEADKRGTPNFMAPEMISQEMIDHRIDLYSFGVLLYYIIYNKLPFDGKNEKEIFKNHLEGNVDYPSTSFRGIYIEIIKKLIALNPIERYYTSLQIFDDLRTNIPAKVKSHFRPVKTSVSTAFQEKVLKAFLEDESQKVLLLKGNEGDGKSTLLGTAFSRMDSPVLIDIAHPSESKESWKGLLEQLIYNRSIYFSLTDELNDEAGEIIYGSEEKIFEKLRSFFTRLSSTYSFSLLIDHINQADELLKEILTELILIARINGSKIIIAEDKCEDSFSEKLRNITICTMELLDRESSDSLIEKSFAPFFDRKTIKELAEKYSYHSFGSLYNFLFNLSRYHVLDFYPSGPVINTHSNVLQNLGKSRSDHLMIIKEGLSRIEIKILEYLALFEKGTSSHILSRITYHPERALEHIVDRLESNRILNSAGAEKVLTFKTEAMREFFYSETLNSDEKHLEAAKVLSSLEDENLYDETARQYELGGNFESAALYFKKELEKAGKFNTWQYARSISSHVLGLNISTELRNFFEVSLCTSLYKLGEFKLCLDHIHKLETLEQIDQSILLEMEKLKGQCLYFTGDYEQSLKTLNACLEFTEDPDERNDILLTTANNYLDLNRFDDAGEICISLINSDDSADEVKGNAYNIFGLLHFYSDRDLDSAIENFNLALNHFSAANVASRIAGTELNLGNIFNIKGEKEKAEFHWNRALDLNLSVGNLDQEARLLLNNGIYYFEKMEFEEATKQYRKAYEIFSSLGNKYGEGLVLSNLGEIFLISCEYDNSAESLRNAASIFHSLGNIEEEIEALFLLGRFYSSIGNKNELDKVISLIKNYSSKGKLNERQTSILKYLEILSLYSNEKFDEAITEIMAILPGLREDEDLQKYIELKFLYIETLILSGNKKRALRHLEDNKLQMLTRDNKYYQAKKYYFLALSNIDSPEADFLSLLEKAYDILKENSIVELTWQVLYSLSKGYNSRGLINQASEFALYTKSLLGMIFDNIEDKKIFDSYSLKISLNEILEILDNLSGE